MFIHMKKVWNVMNTSFFEQNKNSFVSFGIDVFLAYIIVSIFRNDYETTSVLTQVFYFLLIVFCLQLLLGIKNAFSSYVIYKLFGSQAYRVELDNFIKLKFPKPSEMFHFNDAEDYFQDVMLNTEANVDARIYATSMLTTISALRKEFKLINLYIILNSYKKVIKDYARYCESNHID